MFSPRPRGKSVIGKILFECMVKVAKVSLKKVCVEWIFGKLKKKVWNQISQKAKFLDQ